MDKMTICDLFRIGQIYSDLGQNTQLQIGVVTRSNDLYPDNNDVFLIAVKDQNPAALHRGMDALREISTILNRYYGELGMLAEDIDALIIRIQLALGDTV